MNAPSSPSPRIDTDRIDDAVLALLWLGVHDKNGATWKSFDWAAMERLHEQGAVRNTVHGTQLGQDISRLALRRAPLADHHTNARDAIDPHAVRTNHDLSRVIAGLSRGSVRSP
jgi:hypothetical protein